ncbi:sigma factor [Jiangella gansuensis]|uniref:sigma factor n=1 Tax=Jiangella gansuensis TaxID=281473 RepID=UPI0004B27B31|nr:sigma factor [Jiangella gansuensis]
MSESHRRADEFTVYVSARRAYLRRIAYLVCGDWHTAEDLVQSALIKLYTAWPRIHTAGAEDAYVRRIIVRGHLDERRRPWRREQPGLQGIDEPEQGGPSPEDTDEGRPALRPVPRGCDHGEVIKMAHDTQLRELFDRMEFAGEPPMTSTVADDLRRGQRHLRRRRAAGLLGGVATTALVAGGVVFALPSDPGSEITAAGDAGTSAPAEPEVAQTFGVFPSTETLLLDTAAEHLDPSRDHLPDELGPALFGDHGVEFAVIGSQLPWSEIGQAGAGVVKVAVTTPGYVDATDHALPSRTWGPSWKTD